MPYRKNTGPEIFLKCLLIFMVSAPIFSAFTVATKPEGKNLKEPQQLGGLLLIGAVGAIAIPALMVAGTKNKSL